MQIPHTDIEVFPLCLGGNVFGWTADESQSFAVLDAYAAAGGNFIDTADSYSAWVDGHVGGESEAVIGRWMASRRNRARMIVATKVGRLAGRLGLSAENIRISAENSLRRLGVERIDLYYAHADDPNTPFEEALGAFDTLVKAGKVRAIAASNYTAPRLAEALAVSRRNGLARYVALQPHYNLVQRADYESALAPLCEREQLACFPFFGLAKGFLTGKYRPGVTVDSPRNASASAYLDETGLRVLAALDDIANARDTTVATVALAWLKAQPTVTAPIASARTPAQLAELLPMVRLELSAAELERLTSASEAKAARGA